MHAAASQERNTFTFVLARPIGCAILDALRAEQWKITTHKWSTRVSPQSEFWQLTEGDCQQRRNESGWKEGKDPLWNWSTLVSELANLFSRSPFTMEKSILKHRGGNDAPLQTHRGTWQPSGLRPKQQSRAAAYQCSSSGIRSLSINSTNFSNVKLLIQTHFRLAVSSNSPITVAVFTLL